MPSPARRDVHKRKLKYETEKLKTKYNRPFDSHHVTLFTDSKGFKLQQAMSSYINIELYARSGAEISNDIPQRSHV